MTHLFFLDSDIAILYYTGRKSCTATMNLNPWEDADDFILTQRCCLQEWESATFQSADNTEVIGNKTPLMEAAGKKKIPRLWPFFLFLAWHMATAKEWSQTPKERKREGKRYGRGRKARHHQRKNVGLFSERRCTALVPPKKSRFTTFLCKFWHLFFLICYCI